MYFKQRLIILSLLVSSLVSFGQVTVTKRVQTSKNPTLKVNTHRYPATAAKLSRLLAFSDWFTMSKSTSADYTLTVLAQTATSISFQIQPRGGKPVAFTKTSRKGQLLYRKTADLILNKLFKVPGLLASQVAFSGGSNTKKEVYVGFPDALHAATQLTHNKGLSVEPTWSPNGKKLAYTLYGSRGTNVILVDLLRKNHKRISAQKGMNAGFTFSKDGRYGSLILSRDGKVELYRMDLRTYKLKRLTNNRYEESAPTFSPDGSKILAVCNHRRVANLTLFNSINGKMQTLFPSWAECVSPDWSSVSNKICFSMKTGSGYSIAVIDMNNPKGGVKLATKIAGTWESPSWAPDGRHIICVRKYKGRSYLYMVDSWYGKTKQLSTARNLTSVVLPAWSPLY